MTIEEAWVAADKTCFERMKKAVGSSTGKGKAFPGYLPESATNVWMFTSGGSAENQMGRLAGPTPQFCSLAFNARAICAYAKREDAMLWAGRVYEFLNKTNNLQNTGNVQWLRLAAHVAEPLLTALENGRQVWVVEIPLEMIFATETTFE